MSSATARADKCLQGLAAASPVREQHRTARHGTAQHVMVQHSCNMTKLAAESHRSSSCKRDDCNVLCMILAVMMLQFRVYLCCTPTAASGVLTMHCPTLSEAGRSFGKAALLDLSIVYRIQQGSFPACGHDNVHFHVQEQFM